MAPTYGARDALGAHLALVGVVAAPMIAGSAFHLFPHVFVNLLVLIPALIWSIYLLYKGLPIALQTTPEQGMLMASSLVAYLLVGAVTRARSDGRALGERYRSVHRRLSVANLSEAAPAESYRDRVVTALVVFSIIWSLLGMARACTSRRNWFGQRSISAKSGYRTAGCDRCIPTG